MRVLQVVPEFQGGGGEFVAVSLHHWMIDRGVDCRIISLLGDVNESRTARAERATFVEGYGKSWYRLYRLCRLMDKQGWRPDVVHAHMYPSQILAATLLKQLWPNATFSTTEHSTWNRRRNLPCGRYLDSCLFRQFDSIVCISQAALDSLTDWQPELATRMEVIRNGIDVSIYSHAAIRTRTARTVIVSVGRLEPVKNYGTALAAFALLKDSSLEYWIIGKGSDASKLRLLAEKLGIAEQVRFMGWRDDIPGLLRDADIFFMPSLWEGYGLALAQGMASGLPVVASDIPASRELLGSSKAGYLVQPRDAQGFANAMRILVGDPGLRGVLGNEARRRAGVFDFGKTANQYLQLFKNLSCGPCRRSA
jgi:glycosyltransferase involved in cell wall biosynthesis